MSLLKRKNKITDPIIEEKEPKIEVFSPQLLIGISPFAEKPKEEVDNFLDNKFNESKHKKCEICGASIMEKMRHKMSINKAWFNACGMCYYSSNLDLIPSGESGSVVYFPFLDQQRLNGMLRALWCMEYMCSIEPENKSLLLFQDSISELQSIIKNSKHVSDGYFVSSDTEVYTSMMFLLKPEEYRDRYKLFKNFKWFPERRVFESEVAFWAQNDYLDLHPEKMSSNITKFMSQYSKDYDIKK